MPIIRKPKACYPYTWWLRRILFSLPLIRTLVLRRHASRIQRACGMVIQEVSIPWGPEDSLASVRAAVLRGPLDGNANTVGESVSKPKRKHCFVSFLVPEPFVEVELTEEWVKANPAIAAEFMEYLLERRIPELEDQSKRWEELSRL